MSLMMGSVAATKGGRRATIEAAAMVELPLTSECNDGWVDAPRSRRHNDGGSLCRSNGSSDDGIAVPTTEGRRVGAKATEMLESPPTSEYNDGWVDAPRGRGLRRHAVAAPQP